jgi:inner membrane transporter RhtA
VIPPWALVVVSIVSVQLGAAIAKSLFELAGSGGVVFIRTFLGGVILLLLTRPRLGGHSPQVYRLIAIYGVTIAANMLLFYAAIARIPLGITVAIAFLGPLSISVLSSRRLLDLLWVALAAGGILLLSPFTDTALDPIGIGLAFLTALAWAAFILATKRASGIMPGSALLALSMCVAAVVSAPFGAAKTVAVLASPPLLAIALIVALLSSVAPFWLEFTALRRLSPRVFSLLMSLEPAVAALMGWLVLRETLGWEQLAGIALVTVAAVGTTRDADH